MRSSRRSATCQARSSGTPGMSTTRTPPTPASTSDSGARSGTSRTTSHGTPPMVCWMPTRVAISGTGWSPHSTTNDTGTVPSSFSRSRPMLSCCSPYQSMSLSWNVWCPM